jgi:hypothetical protein
MQKEVIMTYFQVLFQYLPSATEENYETLGQDRPCLARDSNRSPSEYKSEALPLKPAFSMTSYFVQDDSPLGGS